MSLLEQLRKENMQAMKDKDPEKKSICTLLMSGLLLAEKEKKEALTSQEELAIVQKELKQTKETLLLTPESRTDLIESAKKKISLLETYLPQQMDAQKITQAVNDIMQELQLEAVKKNQGTIMKEFMAKYRGQADGKEVANVLGSLLK